MNKKELPLYIATFYSGYLFLNKGIDSGIENWRFYASLFGFLGFITLLFLSNKWKKKNIDQKPN